MKCGIISIIVPLYNSALFLEKCLESIKLQSFCKFEVLLIDDGSTDSSNLIYEEYVEKDGRFIAFRKPNGGVSSARNFGINHAQGEYVLFIDSDDILPTNALENHLNNFSRGVDMTMGSFEVFSEESIDKYCVNVEVEEIVSTETCLSDFTPNGKQDWQRYLWNRMFRMSIIRENNIRFNEKIAYKEDGLFIVQYLLRCKGNVAYFPEIVYRYRLNHSSAMGVLSTVPTEKLVTNIKAHALIINEMKSANVSEDILKKEIRHAFQSRRWVLDKFSNSGKYKTIWFQTLLTLFHAVGILNFIRISIESVGGKIHKMLRK